MKQSSLNHFFKANHESSKQSKRARVDHDGFPNPYSFARNGTTFTLSDKQRQVLRLAMKGQNLFFTGSAGVGKSLLLTAIVEEMRKRHGLDRVYVTAATGVAACNIGGTTLHSFAGVGLGTKAPDDLVKRVRGDSRAVRRWKQCKVLVIDEISMIDAEFFDKLDHVAREVRGRKYDAFGGIQLVICGDFLQLPPVPQTKMINNVITKVPIHFCFESKAWKAAISEDNCIELVEIFRQREADFVDLLQAVRYADLKPKHVALLKSRVGCELQSEHGVQPTILYPHRRDVKAENIAELDKLDTPERVYHSIDHGTARHLELLDKSCQAPKELVLKKGAQVVLLRNLDFELGLVNGARGVIVGFEEPLENVELTLAPQDTLVPAMLFSNGLKWQIGREDWKLEMGPLVLASRRQFPLMLCWACSIHKSQGLTLDLVRTKLASVFAPGQAYVSLSRCTSLEGLSLVSLDIGRIRAHPRVLDFYRKMAENGSNTKTSRTD